MSYTYTLKSPVVVSELFAQLAPYDRMAPSYRLATAAQVEHASDDCTTPVRSISSKECSSRSRAPYDPQSDQQCLREAGGSCCPGNGLFGLRAGCSGPDLRKLSL